MVPDAGVVRDFLEVLEFRELRGVVFTQTAWQALQNTRGRRYTTEHCTECIIQMISYSIVSKTGHVSSDSIDVLLDRHFNRLRGLLKDHRYDCVLFANEFQQFSYCPRGKGETQEKWQTR